MRDALAQAELAAAKAEEDAAAVAQERAELLLDADDKRLDAVERRLQLAQREADRGAAAVAALQERALTLLGLARLSSSKPNAEAWSPCAEARMPR